ncbi:MAG: DUF5958 family protein [Bacteroides sp.]|nr:DUF5958 family protein [Bacteroides sp.]
MEIEQEILINQYGQRVVDINRLMPFFKNSCNKKALFDEILYLIMQSKPKQEDIEPTIVESKLKPTYTPCVLLRKGFNNNLYKIIDLPDNESEKAFILLLSLFRICYYRRFQQEKNNPDKWWYWDLSDKKNVEKIISLYK